MSVAQPMISVVHDYAILYSNRILQKDKKWSDGRLRFYELNNKMEVYSEEHSLIASDFYPSTRKSPLQSGAFEEGKEFKLPSGKLLLSIESYLGCSMRDVSKVFKKPSEKTTVPQSPVVKQETYIKSEHTFDPVSASAYVSVKHMPIKSEPKDTVEAAPKQPKPRRIGLTRNRTAAKRQSDLSSFVRRPTVEFRLRNYFHGPSLKTIRIPPRSANLYRRLHQELAVDKESAVHLGVKELETGLTQAKTEYA